MKPRELAMLMLLGAIWGSSFLFISLAVKVFGPAPLVLYRVVLAGAALLIYARLSHQSLELRTHWRKFLLLGALNAAVPFTLIAFAELSLPASFASILNSVTPMFTAVLSVFLLGDGLYPRRVLGLVLGVVGVSLVVGWSPFDLTSATLLAIVAMLMASLFYGLGTVYSKRSFKGVSILTMAVGQQLGAALVMSPLAVVNLPRTMTVQALIPATLLALVGTALAYLLYFTLLQRVGATNTSSVTLIVPVFGILWGVLLLGETLTVGTLVGFGVILVSLVLITGVGLSQRKLKPA